MWLANTLGLWACQSKLCGDAGCRPKNISRLTSRCFTDTELEDTPKTNSQDGTVVAAMTISVRP